MEELKIDFSESNRGKEQIIINKKYNYFYIFSEHHHIKI